MASFLLESIHHNTLVKKEKHIVGGVQVGELLFRPLISKAFVDTKAIPEHLREKLANLDSYILTIASNNINVINQFVKVNEGREVQIN